MTSVTTNAEGDVVTFFTTFYASPTSEATTSPSSNIGAITGGVIGGLFAAFLFAIIGLLLYRRRLRQKSLFDGNFDPARVSVASPTAEMLMVANDTLSDGRRTTLSSRTTSGWSFGHV